MTASPAGDRDVPGAGAHEEHCVAGAPPEASNGRIAGPRAAGDTGAADEALSLALGRWAQARDRPAQAGVYAALPTARVFVPVVATLLESGTAAGTGLRAEKSAEMSVVTLVSPSGATALPAFLSTESLRRWRLDARPVPVTGLEVCLAATDGGHAAVVVEPQGVVFPVEEPALTALAGGWVPAAGSASGASVASRRVAEGVRFTPPVRPLPGALQDRLATVLAAEPAVAAAYLVDAVVGDEPPAPTVGVVLARGLDRQALAALVGRLGRALADDLAAAGGLDVAVLGGREAAEVARWASPLPVAPLPVAPLPVPAGTAPARGSAWWRRRR